MGDKFDINTHQWVRIRILDELLATRKLTKEELIDQVILGMEAELSKVFSYSPRSFDNDKIELEKKLNARNEDENLEGNRRHQILKIREKRAGKIETFYKYNHPHVSAFEHKLDTEDIQILLDAVGLIDQIKGFNWNFNIQDVLKRLDQQIKFKTKIGPNVIGLQSIVAEGYQYLYNLNQCVIDKMVIGFEYEAFGEEKIRKVIHPYYIKQYNNRWFLLGYDEKRSGVSIFPLDRIKSKIEPLSEISFKSPENIFDPKEYFKDIIGVTNYENKPVEEIVLQFAKNTAPYIISKKIHESQEIIEKKEDGSVIVKLFVKQNFELKNFILGYGSAVTVLEPKALRQEMKDQALEILSKY